jgi:hypothetical protein
MKIPTHWKEQHALPVFANCGEPLASNFSFLWSDHGTDSISKETIPLSPEDDGRMLFFPSRLEHMVFPFYECEEERVSISGNIRMHNPNISNKRTRFGDPHEDKENILKIMEKQVKILRKEMEDEETSLD